MKSKATKPVAKKKNGAHVVKTGEYKGKPMFEVHSAARIEAGEDFTILFSCGMGKAKIIAEHIDELKAFVEENSED